MKIALIGYGRMGRVLEKTAGERGHIITAVVEPFLKGEPPRGAGGKAAPAVFASIAEAGDLGGAEAALDFTGPAAAPLNIRAAAERRIPLVAGSTGWYEQLPELTAFVEKAGAALLWSSNFSLGVNLFYKIAEYAARLADPFAEYDAGGWETHHNKKADSPSGTAKTLAEKVLAQMTRKTEAVYDKLDRPPEPRELHYASLRSGSVPGVHTLLFDSPADTIEIIHTARSRDGFADGAILAAEWLVAEARPGIFTMDDVI